jgi:regulator of protease activity HflC (stomatin/prohibitin superfamily)
VSRAETEKLLLVKKAEAEAESKRLQGEGIANQRKAIIAGLRESVSSFSSSIEGATAKDAVALVLMTQYFDMMKEVAATNRSNTILIPHSPSTLGELFGQIRDAVMVAGSANSASAPGGAVPAAPRDRDRQTGPSQGT